MNVILRTFFYSFGLSMLICAWTLNPDTAEFKDLLRFLHATDFWQLVGLFSMMLLGAEMMLPAKITGVRAVVKPAGLDGAGRSGQAR